MRDIMSQSELTRKGYYIWDLHTGLLMYSNHLNTCLIWIPDSMGVRYSKGKVTWLGGQFECPTFWTINRPFSVWFSDHHSNTGPFDHLDTNLPFEYQTSSVFRWLLYWSKKFKKYGNRTFSVFGCPVIGVTLFNKNCFVF